MANIVLLQRVQHCLYFVRPFSGSSKVCFSAAVCGMAKQLYLPQQYRTLKEVYIFVFFYCSSCVLFLFFYLFLIISLVRSLSLTLSCGRNSGSSFCLKRSALLSEYGQQ
jgi:hypothetical protein